MKLSDFFGSALKQVNDSSASAGIKKDEAVSTERLNRQIKALTPGRQLQGEIISKNGSEVKIRLAGDMVLTARLEQDVNVEEGRILTFEVKNNGSALFLSPLFANTATADNVFKALQMAGLPVNNTTVAMTEAMMQQGMSVDARSLQNVFRDVSANPGSAPADVVRLHQMEMAVNEGNLQQMESYRALTHQLVRGMTDVLNELPMAFEELYAAVGPDKPVQMYGSILQQMFPSAFGSEGVMSAYPEAGSLPELSGNLTQMPGELTQMSGILPETPEGLSAETAGAAQNLQGTVSELLSPGEREHLGSMISRMEAFLAELPEETTVEGAGLREALHRLTGSLEQGSAGTGELLKVLSGLTKESRLPAAMLADVFRSGEFRKIFDAAVLKQWSLEPGELAEDGRVEELYTRLTKQLDGVREALQDAGAGQSMAAKSTAGLSQNIDFMNQMNQMYTYVQLPLKMSGQNANGELYVFTNKRSLAKNDGNVSAFLHLDMENLGPVDVYVAMQNERVSTRFTLRDDEMLDFLNEHMYILNERLTKKGYALKYEMTVKDGQEAEENPVDRILQADRNITMLAQYAFDVRA